MKYLVLVLCGLAALALAAGSARAFDIQGQSASLQDDTNGTNHLASPVDQFFNPDYTKGSSLALPYIGKGDTSSFISDYGNGIAIPGPGVDRPAPAWAYR